MCSALKNASASLIPNRAIASSVLAASASPAALRRLQVEPSPHAEEALPLQCSLTQDGETCMRALLTHSRTTSCDNLAEKESAHLSVLFGHNVATTTANVSPNASAFTWGNGIGAAIFNGSLDSSLFCIDEGCDDSTHPPQAERSDSSLVDLPFPVSLASSLFGAEFDAPPPPFVWVVRSSPPVSSPSLDVLSFSVHLCMPNTRQASFLSSPTIETSETLRAAGLMFPLLRSPQQRCVKRKGQAQKKRTFLPSEEVDCARALLNVSGMPSPQFNLSESQMLSSCKSSPIHVLYNEATAIGNLVLRLERHAYVLTSSNRDHFSLLSICNFAAGRALQTFLNNHSKSVLTTATKVSSPLHNAALSVRLANDRYVLCALVDAFGLDAFPAPPVGISLLNRLYSALLTALGSESLLRNDVDARMSTVLCVVLHAAVAPWLQALRVSLAFLPGAAELPHTSMSHANITHNPFPAFICGSKNEQTPPALLSSGASALRLLISSAPSLVATLISHDCSALDSFKRWVLHVITRRCDGAVSHANQGHDAAKIIAALRTALVSMQKKRVAEDVLSFQLALWLCGLKDLSETVASPQGSSLLSHSYRHQSTFVASKNARVRALSTSADADIKSSVVAAKRALFLEREHEIAVSVARRQTVEQHDSVFTTNAARDNPDLLRKARARIMRQFGEKMMLVQRKPVLYQETVDTDTLTSSVDPAIILSLQALANLGPREADRAQDIASDLGVSHGWRAPSPVILSANGVMAPPAGRPSIQEEGVVAALVPRPFSSLPELPFSSSSAFGFGHTRVSQPPGGWSVLSKDLFGSIEPVEQGHSETARLQHVVSMAPKVVRQDSADKDTQAESASLVMNKDSALVLHNASFYSLPQKVSSSILSCDLSSKTLFSSLLFTSSLSISSLSLESSPSHDAAPLFMMAPLYSQAALLNRAALCAILLQGDLLGHVSTLRAWMLLGDGLVSSLAVDALCTSARALRGSGEHTEVGSLVTAAGACWLEAQHNLGYTAQADELLELTRLSVREQMLKDSSITFETSSATALNARALAGISPAIAHMHRFCYLPATPPPVSKMASSFSLFICHVRACYNLGNDQHELAAQVISSASLERYSRVHVFLLHLRAACSRLRIIWSLLMSLKRASRFGTPVSIFTFRHEAAHTLGVLDAFISDSVIHSAYEDLTQSVTSIVARATSSTVSDDHAAPPGARHLRAAHEAYTRTLLARCFLPQSVVREGADMSLHLSGLFDTALCFCDVIEDCVLSWCKSGSSGDVFPSTTLAQIHGLCTDFRAQSGALVAGLRASSTSASVSSLLSCLR